MLKKLVPQRIPHRCAAHGQTGVTAIGFIDGINGQHADAVDAERVERSGCGGHGMKRRGEDVGIGLSLVLAHASEGEADVVTTEAEGIGQHCSQC